MTTVVSLYMCLNTSKESLVLKKSFFIIFLSQGNIGVYIHFVCLTWCHNGPQTEKRVTDFDAIKFAFTEIQEKIQVIYFHS